MSAPEYDLVVIGGGSGGVRAARLAAAAGMKVAIIEQSAWGGTCVNVGCVPKKLMKYAADFGRAFKDASEYGWTFNAPGFDWNHFIRIKNAEIERLGGLYAGALARVGAEVIEGHAQVIEPNKVDVGDRQLDTHKILIATGGRPFIPDIPGADLALSSEQIFYLDRQPDKILIVGGGFIALEFGSIFRGFGSEVVQVYRGELFLRGFDHDLRQHMAKELAQKGADVRFNLDVDRLERTDSGRLKVSLSDASALEVDQVFYATGRTPNLEKLLASGLGVELEESGTIKVDSNFKTSVDSIYAIGDVVGRMALTPVAIAEAKALVNHWLENTPIAIDYRLIPQAVFSSPSIATVGYTEEEAIADGLPVEIYEASFRTLKDSLTAKSDKTYMKMVVNTDNRRVLGIHLVGEDVAEILQAAAVALGMGATKEDFDRTVGIHPTTAEELVTMHRVSRAAP